MIAVLIEEERSGQAQDRLRTGSRSGQGRDKLRTGSRQGQYRVRVGSGQGSTTTNDDEHDDAGNDRKTSDTGNASNTY